VGTKKQCHFYRISDSPVMGCGIGYCDFDSIWAICDGDIQFCEKPDYLIKNLYDEFGKKRIHKMKYEVQSGA